ncbi:hypothetical protein M407DRAFT_246823 [Tulasnella calospora MUT 4182]|uniref:Uncharacterized protein n=1 Tax=Tulasnella calospora MUT 4182 TaxID=1051891 RepID=A0A0C3K717_9AGAM|nr:hypothetical protein M407DRAFT_246823 [Tulasnella calospora MUT 4182]
MLEHIDSHRIQPPRLRSSRTSQATILARATPTIGNPRSHFYIRLGNIQGEECADQGIDTG